MSNLGKFVAGAVFVALMGLALYAAINLDWRFLAGFLFGIVVAEWYYVIELKRLRLYQLYRSESFQAGLDSVAD